MAKDLPDRGPVDPGVLVNFVSKVSWSITDPQKFHGLMDQVLELVEGGVYFGDNLFTWGRNNSIFDDDAFVSSWHANSTNDQDRAIAWRRYVLATLACHAVHLEGDFVECGVYRGSGIKTTIDYFGKDRFTKTFWGFDTFDYNPAYKEGVTDQKPGFFEEIEARFEGYPMVRLERGLIPDVFEFACPESIALLHIDLNHADSEIAALEALFERVVPGGTVVLDDYEWAGRYRGQKMVEDAWFDERGYRVVPLPTGQGFVIKR